MDDLIDIIGNYLSLVVGDKQRKSKILTIVSIIIIALFIIIVVYKF